VPFVGANVLDRDVVRDAMVEHGVVGVVHLAAFKYAGVSVQKPLVTYEQNVAGTLALLIAMEEAGVDKIVFSSSAATFGTPDVDVVTEQTPTNPESPYGESKLIGEWILRDQERATGLRQTSLRYFNVVGSADPSLYDTSPHNLFPLVLEALAEGRTPHINGDDYPTPDGTCVRDYIHVADLGEAHALALDYLRAGGASTAINLGNGQGYSVLEVVEAARRVTEMEIKVEMQGRRAGDPSHLVADARRAREVLGWQPRVPEISAIISSAWDWHTSHPRGYDT
jgi:UDP-glucose 4-epimerase